MSRARVNRWQMGRISGLMALALLAGGCTLNLSPGSQMSRVEKTVVVPQVAGAGLSVQTRNGSIEVTRSDRQDVQIVARIAAQADQRAEAVEIVAERCEDGSLRVEAVWPDGKPLNNEGCSFSIQLPEADGLDLKTSNGSITITHLAGHAKLVTSNGAIRMQGHAGSADASTSNGSIHIRQITGPIEARTSNGRIELQPAPDNQGPFNLHTSNGSIDLTLGAAFTGRLRLETSNGRIYSNDLHGAIRIESSKHYLLVAFDDSEQTSKASTSNGSITVRSSASP